MACKVYIKAFDNIDSTNRYAREEAGTLWNESGGAEVVAVTALNQTAGRGQRGNVWSSACGENLLVSILVKPCSLNIKEQFRLSQVISLAALHAMEHYGMAAEIKWPNDIYVGKRKLAGILVEIDCEAAKVEKAVIGVGLNVNQCLFPEMDRVPVSMAMLGGREYCIEEVRDKLLESFLYYYDMLERGVSLDKEYMRRLKGYMLPMQYSDGKSLFEAVIKDVEPNGALCLERTTGETGRYGFKEVELLL